MFIDVKTILGRAGMVAAAAAEGLVKGWWHKKNQEKFNFYFFLRLIS